MADYKETSTEDLIKELIDSELIVGPKLARAISERPDAVSHLITIIEDDRYYEEGGAGDGWTPIHAGFLLGSIRTQEALDALFYLLREREDDLGEWITEDFISILANFGPEYLEALKTCVSDQTIGPRSRSTAAAALALIAHKYPEIWSPVVEFFKKLLKNETDEMFLTFIAGPLVEMKDKSLLNDIKTLIKEDRIDKFYISEEDIENAFNAPEEETQNNYYDRDPLEHFSPEELASLWETFYEDKEMPEELKEALARK